MDEQGLSEGIRSIAAAFVGSRVLYLAFVLAIALFTVGNVLYGGGRGFGQAWGTWLSSALFNSDSGFYYSVAVHGYAHVPFNTGAQYNWAFFPLYPWLTRTAGALFGPAAIVPSGYVISSVAFAGSLWFLWKWARIYLSASSAQLVVVLAAFNPLTPYFLAYRAGSLFFLLSVLTLWAVARQRWAWALLWGALAALARPTGILLAIPYLMAVWMATEYALMRRLTWIAGGITFAAGFVVVAIIDAHVSGNPLAFLAIQTAWQRGAEFPFLATLVWLHHPGQSLTVQGGMGVSSPCHFLHRHRRSPGALDAPREAVVALGLVLGARDHIR